MSTDDEPLHITIHRGRRPELPDADARVVIDVIRAFTTAQVAFRCGVERILLADTLAQARDLAASSSRRLLAGERNAIAPEGFDFGNSPAELDEADLSGRELVLTTTNGVKATLHALDACPVYVTGFSNAGATVDTLRGHLDESARRIQLIASHPEGDEDLASAEWIRAHLLGEPDPDDAAVLHRIRTCAAAAKFLDPDRPDYRADDIDYCASRDDADWAMRVITGDEAPVVRTE